MQSVIYATAGSREGHWHPGCAIAWMTNAMYCGLPGAERVNLLALPPHPQPVMATATEQRRRKQRSAKQSTNNGRPTTRPNRGARRRSAKPSFNASRRSAKASKSAATNRAKRELPPSTAFSNRLLPCSQRRSSACTFDRWSISAPVATLRKHQSLRRERRKSRTDRAGNCPSARNTTADDPAWHRPPFAGARQKCVPKLLR